MKSAHSLLSLMAWTCARSFVFALYLNITAIGAQNGASTLECWEMETPFSTSTTPGTNGSASVILGNVTSLSYTITPPGLDGGYHNAAHNQWVYFVSGLAYITLPTNDVSVYVTGEYGLIFAADTAGASILGHRTQYLGTTETVSIAMPTKDGSIPAHILLHYGPCAQRDFVGYDDLVGVDLDFTRPYTVL